MTAKTKQPVKVAAASVLSIEHHAAEAIRRYVADLSRTAEGRDRLADETRIPLSDEIRLTMAGDAIALRVMGEELTRLAAALDGTGQRIAL